MQTKYSFFYKVRRNERWRSKYYKFFEENKNNKKLTFKDVIEFLYKKIGQIEESFSSKIHASINPNMLILDQLVLNNLELKLTENDSIEKLNNAIIVYDEIKIKYDDLLTSGDVKKTIEHIKKIVPVYNLSDVKILDFILWSSR